jgi:hypothetical protein
MPDLPGIDFRRGIDLVSRHQPEEEPRLPDSDALVPGDSAVTQKLDRVLFEPSAGELALERLRPAVSDRALLGSGRYSRLAEEAESALRDRLELKPDDPDSPKFERLARLLEDERDLRSLLDQHRNVLHKG